MTHRPYVLFIDGDPAVTACVSDALSTALNFEFLRSGSFDLADRFLEEKHIDVLIADIQTPGSGIGSHFITQFAAHFPAAGIVLVSARRDLVAAFYPAYSVCLQKPYDVEKLMDAVFEAQLRAPGSSKAAADPQAPDHVMSVRRAGH